MEIVVLDGYTENPGDLSWDAIRKLGRLTVYDRTCYEESRMIAARIGDAEVAVTNKTPISRETMEACPNLKLVTVLSERTDVVDLDFAAKRGIRVQNAPDFSAPFRAQFAVGLLLEICSRYGDHDRSVKAGKWESHDDWCYWEHPMIELCGKTAGIIGGGEVAEETGRILQSLRMRVLTCGIGTDTAEPFGNIVSLDELLSESDVIFLFRQTDSSRRIPDGSGTEKAVGGMTDALIRRDSISRMKDGVILINISDGGMIREKDLAEALNSGKVYAAGLDTVSTQPIMPDNPLKRAKNTIITPAISWASREARQRIMDLTAGNIRSYLEGSPVNVVNDPVRSIYES